MSDEKKISMKEFRMWLQGVEEMQADDWVPDARQWQRIREKIDSVDDGQPVVQTPAVSAPVQQQPAQTFAPPLPAVPAGPSMMPPPSRMAQGPASGPFAKGNTPVRTPDIDSSSGKYESSFA